MSEIREFQIKNESETAELAEELAARLGPGDLVALYGDLGTGKTTFCKAAIRALGVAETVTSPTFTIVKEYRGRLPVYHFDVYRVHSEEDLFEIGCEEYFFGQGVCFVEWADLIEGLLEEVEPEHLYRIRFEYTEEEEGRRILIEYPGD
ncbi:MAG: tRNA (adenosine(37)-N6)-threonylcarbamoyltransferase complex ATPase subunit type 1 TsaE [Firmicutes bacterium]|nr:tRNA (adenosine(37)-N6)-threonylcarbamoyltransferase complex ATPase subunit type 1 TsaE [Bacillota bacterium]